MASFKPTVITDKGLALMAKLAAGKTKMEFTKVSVSNTQYTQNVSELTELTSIKQTALVSNITVINKSSVKVDTTITNKSLNSGYYINTIGLYAMDPDEGEILYSVTCAETADWMPPDNGLTVSTILVQLITAVSNAATVNVTLDPSMTATIQHIIDLQAQIDDIKGYIGYTDEDIIGVEFDFEDSSCTRLAGSKYLRAGEDFDSFNMYGGRRRCNVLDDGTIAAYYGEDGYAVDGSNGQVMVEQPKFYYKFVPLKLVKMGNRDGFVCTKFRLYLCDTYKRGFKIHPNFTRGVPAQIKDAVYMSAYEASIYDTSSESYLLNNEPVGDFTQGSGDKLSSISGAMPATGAIQALTRLNARTIANNRGDGFQQFDILSLSCTQMLFLVEYASFNSQEFVGLGVKPSADNSVPTGSCDDLGNGTGESNSGSVTYRGEENLWGNISSFMDGINFERDISDDGNINGNINGYFALGDFSEDTKTEPYMYIGCQPYSQPGSIANKYTGGICWSEKFDFAFICASTGSSGVTGLCDTFIVDGRLDRTGFLSVRAGTPYSDAYNVTDDGIGLFQHAIMTDTANKGATTGARLLFIPEGGKSPEYYA